MEFRLPTNLQTQLLAYDPKLKHLQREQKSTEPKAKPKFPLGAVFDLIPADVVDPDTLQRVVTEINSREVKHRHAQFKRLVDPTNPNAGSITHAIIYHYEKIWYAAWLPPRGQEKDYVYGYAYAYKNLDSMKQSIPTAIHMNTDSQDIEYIKYGRSEFRVVRKNLTKEAIANGKTYKWWNLFYIQYHKGEYIRNTIRAFESALKDTIPQWEDSHGFFDRFTLTSFAKILEMSGLQKYWQTFSDPVQAQIDMVPSADLFYTLADIYKNAIDYSYEEFYRIAHKIMHIIGKPFFRKWIQAQCDESIAMFNDPDNSLLAKVKQPWQRIETLVNTIAYVNDIWPDCPVDFYQTHLEQLLGTRFDRHSDRKTQEWLCKHMQPATFFNILKKFYNDKIDSMSISELNRSIDRCIGVVVFYFGDWYDTISMLSSVLDKDIAIDPPRRWRLTEFHDHVQAEAWKIEHANVKLPQDLFPSPVKVEVNNERWSFFQPHDTHQLSAWGQAVRNCVGNASSYADGIRKKKHFIVLCMVDGQPKFTVQLTVDMGMMSVSQIVSTSNQRLTQEQKDAYTEAFGKALQLQDAALTSV
jgi:hypothetical protein